MKTKELIERLQDADSTGELEVCVENKDIYFVERKEAYWDGRLQRIICDPELRGKCYSVVDGKIVSSGHKVELILMGIEDIIENDPDAPIDLSDAGSEEEKARWEKRIAEWRNEMRLIHAELDPEFRLKEIQEGRDFFNSLEAYCMQDPGKLNPYREYIKGDSYRNWMQGWLDAAANYWESMGSD